MSGVFAGVLRSILAQLAFAGILIGALLYLDHRFPLTVSDKKNGNEATLGFLTALTGISATMLGLYFAAISLVASTAYARVSGEVRALVVGEQVGTFYFAFLTQFAANAVLLLAAFVFGLPVQG